MSSYIRFTPLSGAKDEKPLCYLLEVDEAKILLDCGWSDGFDVADLDELKKYAKDVNVVLLSHSDLPHLGALPYARSYLGLNCAVYATLPTANMGRMCMYDMFQSKTNEEEFTLFSLEDVDNAFDRIQLLRYSQPVELQGNCKGIMITAYAAGHTVGGTIWKLKKDTDEIVYAVDYNHKKERHLDGTVMLVGGMVHDALNRPSLLITDAFNAGNIHPARKHRDAALFSSLMSTLEEGGMALLPTDSAARVLELTYLLDQHWSAYRLPYPLILLTHQSYRTAQYAKSMLEWMGEAITKQFGASRENPFEFKYLRLCHQLEDLAKYPGPKVVLASNLSLDTGYARNLLAEWSADPRNILILTNRGPPDSLARHLFHAWEEASMATDAQVINSAVPLNTQVQITMKRRLPLQGAELAEWNEREREKREREAQQFLMLARNRNIMEKEESDSDDSDADIDDAEMADMLAFRFDVYLKDATKSGGFFKQTQSYRMFPYVERRKKFDEYGEAIVPDHYMRGTNLDGTQFDQFADAKRKQEGREGERREDTRAAPEEVPSKYVTEELDLHVMCRVQYIDLEGLSDGRSVKTILQQVAPKKLILVHGEEKAMEELGKAVLGMDQMTRELYTPSTGETLNVSAATNIFQLKLTDALASSLSLHRLGDYELAYISGQVHFPPDSTTPVLDLPSAENQARWHPPVLVGDLRLSDLKSILQSHGVQAEFKGQGVLVCNERVSVRKTAAGELLVEGAVSEDYYLVRSLIYKQHAIL
ncbi:uncharacterized protein VTP21DRAFT_8337 [Calcarisporiella thermophila]|uniref:uncharacterized protein n=1 Tax=Calcarisporiella thermophila TaxID=911321 RepID=UPI0037441122